VFLGLELGADDYLIKTRWPGELVARCRCPVAPFQHSVLKISGWRVLPHAEPDLLPDEFRGHAKPVRLVLSQLQEYLPA